MAIHPKAIFRLCTVSFLGIVGLVFLSTPNVHSASPPAPVSYEHDVKPILQARCYSCHGNGARLGDFAIDSRTGLLTGGQIHPVVLPGNSAKSYLIKMVTGQIPDEVMPARGPRLTPKEIAVLSAWIDQGVSFGDTHTADSWTAPLAPTRPELPVAAPGSGLTNPIDRLLQPYFAGAKLTPGPVVDDRTYLRRVSLDTVGLLPSPEDIHAFELDKRPGKRARQAARLLNDNRAYADHWLSFWNDMLRNDYTGTGYIDGGRTQISGWLYSALLTNMRYDQFATELINPPTPDSAGFSKGISWRGTVNASQTPAMQVSQIVSQVFLGINLKCASCHNSFVSTWKLADSYGMAGVYSDGPLEMVRCDKPTGHIAPIKFLYPQLGSIDGTAPRAKRMGQLAAALTSPSDGRFARTFVNRLWAKMMGRGLVEPTDEMDNRPWNPALLDWLAADFADHGCDVKRTILLIATSRAYQMPSVGQSSERASNYHFTGPVVKRMTAEQFHDAVSTLTGDWPQPAFLPVSTSGKVVFQSQALLSGSVPIDVNIAGAHSLILVATNGIPNSYAYDWADWVDPVVSGPHGDIRLTDLKRVLGTTGYGVIRTDENVVEQPIRLGNQTFPHGIGTHARSEIVYLLPPGVTRFRALAGPDTGALEKSAAAKDTSAASIIFSVRTDDSPYLYHRADLAVSDPLERALGRPNREQAVTERLTAATTLQALELTNGATLAGMLDKGADLWAGSDPRSPAQRINTLYEMALGRPPTPLERQMALQQIGSPLTKTGMDDLLWSLVMLPEFQLVY